MWVVLKLNLGYTLVVMTDDNLLTFIFIGRSGCGKGTQSKLLISHLKSNLSDNVPILHIETGARLREFIKQDNFSSQKAKAVMVAKELQPSFVPNFIWSKALIDEMTGREHIVIDGSPRKLVEAQIMDSALSFYDRKQTIVVHLNVSRDWSRERLLARGRLDDDIVGIEKRLDWFEEEVTPVIEFFRNSGHFKYLEVNGEDEIDNVHHNILVASGLLK